MGNKTLVTIFTRCFRLIAKLSAGMSDQFFVDLLDQESEKLFDKYIFFLKYQGISTNYVVQCQSELIFQIKNVLKLLDILNHLGFTKPTIPLLLERDLLLLELAILNSRQEERLGGKKGEQNFKPEKNQITSRSLPDFLGQTHKEIIQFITSRKRVQNIEIFSKFSGIAKKRTLKRKLSELIKAGVIKRTINGKKVFYIALSKVKPN